MEDRVNQIKQAFDTLHVSAEIKRQALASVERWLTMPDYAPYHPYIHHLVDAEKWELLLDSFWQMMPFGTGGRRGPVGAGPNRINPYTISLSVQGHCNYLKEVMGGAGELSVVVAHDVRQFLDVRGIYKGLTGVLTGMTSLDLARVSATTYAANGIKALVVGPLKDGEQTQKCTETYISTPELSFMIRYYGAVGGLNISASHNHPDDNGGKFYNRYGGQEIPPDDEVLLQMVEQVREVKTMAYTDAVESGYIEFVSQKAHKEYVALNTALVHTESRSAKIAYTPLCGTGMTTVYETLNTLGFDVVKVAEQSMYDGSFKSVRYRIGNPEVPDSMDLLEKTAVMEDCDVGFATDPDADRLGMIARDADGSWEFINGHEIGVLLIQSIISAKKKKGEWDDKGIFVNTLVTTSLQRTIARSNGLQVVGDLMVGCKYIADVLRRLEDNGEYPYPPVDGKDRVTGHPGNYVFGTEESHGYLVSPDIRDKDACGAAVHLAGLVSELKNEGKTIRSYLRDIYRVYGYHRNDQRSMVMEGIEGLHRIRKIQDVLRSNPPHVIAGMSVIRFTDNHVVGGPLLSSTDEASRNVLLFELDGGNDMVIRLVVRPSGTEPKTKIYVEVPSPRKIGGTLDDVSETMLATISDDELDGIVEETDRRATAISDEFIRYCLGPAVLGNTFPALPRESLWVSDLVTVDNKIALCTTILPALLLRIEQGQEVDRWLPEQLKTFGEDAIGLVARAAKAWINRKENDSNENVKTKALALFN